MDLPAVFFVIVLSILCVNGDNIHKTHRFLEKSGRNLNYIIVATDGSELSGVLGAGFSEFPTDCSDPEDPSQLCFDWTEATLTVQTLNDACERFTWTVKSEASVDRLVDCFEFGPHHWYGGAEQWRQYWPLEKYSFSEYSYVTKGQDSQAVLERYWLVSNGIFLAVDDVVPLFIDANTDASVGQLCFVAENAAPYQPSRTTLNLTYDICAFFNDAKEAHLYAVNNYLGRPSGLPDQRVIEHPIWSTWARYKQDVNEAVVMTFADEILQHGFNNSQLEIDDRWEVCYGSHEIDKNRFPNMRNLTNVLHERGFRVTMWVHPFINVDCLPYFTEASALGHLVTNTEGSTAMTWWNGDAGHIDITNPEALGAWRARLDKIRDEDGIDAFKFDAGESSWLPQLPRISVDDALSPNRHSTLFAEAVSSYGSMIEVRVGFHTQHLPIFVRMLDKDSRWTFENGLKTLVTTLLQMNMVGYPFVLPDMVGGNGYGDVVTKELFIRWLQANTFMPTIQFSYVPWDFDNETVEICKRFTGLHTQYTPTILELARKAVFDGSPINPPIWWISPSDTTAQAIDSEYLLGEDLLVAPVLDEGATSRDVYLPAGMWRDESRPLDPLIEGPILLSNYPAPLDVLPYFTRVSAI